MIQMTCAHPQDAAETRPPTTFFAACEHNWDCPTCGFGFGQSPDPCDDGAPIFYEVKGDYGTA